MTHGQKNIKRWLECLNNTSAFQKASLWEHKISQLTLKSAAWN
jgi:hypothetical protein